MSCDDCDEWSPDLSHGFTGWAYCPRCMAARETKNAARFAGQPLATVADTTEIAYRLWSQPRYLGVDYRALLPHAG